MCSSGGLIAECHSPKGARSRVPNGCPDDRGVQVFEPESALVNLSMPLVEHIGNPKI